MVRIQRSFTNMKNMIIYLRQLITLRRIGIMLIIVIIAITACVGYLHFVKGYVWAGLTGFEGKTIWDILELFIIPTALVLIAFCLNEKRVNVDRQLASERNQEEILQAYLDKTTELLLDKQLLNAKPDSDLQAIAEARTLITLRRLNCERKGLLLRFLSSSRLITVETGKVEALIRLKGTNLSEINLDDAWLLGADLGELNLRKAHLNKAVLRCATLFDTDLTDAEMKKTVLQRAHLEKAKLNQANLQGAFLQEANLTLASLEGADLTDADLTDANLLGANFKGAKLTERQILKAKITEGVIMPDGTKRK